MQASCKLLWTILKHRRYRTKGPKIKKIDKALHSRDDRLHVSRKEGGRGLTSTEDCIDSSILGLEKYIKMSRERLIIADSNSNSDTRTKRKTTKTRKQKWEKKTTAWIFQATNWQNCTEKTRTWHIKENLNKESEYF